jgi:alpha-L-rhamnosidase
MAQSQWIATDESWNVTQGPVIRNNVYLGEHYDARREVPNWNAATTDMGKWKSAMKAKGPSGELTLQLQPPIRITKELQPVSIKEVGKDTFIVDMGQNFAGVARIRVQGPAGKQVVLRYGEDIHPDGRLNFLTTTAGQIKEMWNLKGGPGAPKTAWQEDRYTLKGSGRKCGRRALHFMASATWKSPAGRAHQQLQILQGLRMNSDMPQPHDLCLLQRHVQQIATKP